MRPAPDPDDVAERCGVEVELESDVGLAVDAHVEPGPVDDHPVLDPHRRELQLRQDILQAILIDGSDNFLRDSGWSVTFR